MYMSAFVDTIEIVIKALPTHFEILWLIHVLVNVHVHVVHCNSV